jgi:hypothetical protein
MTTAHTPTPYTLGNGGKNFVALMLGTITIGYRDERQPGARKNMQALIDQANAYGANQATIAELVAALREAEKLAWQVGSETEDGVMTLLEDSRGDLYRQIRAALAKVAK